MYFIHINLNHFFSIHTTYIFYLEAYVYPLFIGLHF